jgi:hypothetical protein
MTPESFLYLALNPALELLPARMTSNEARALILAICLQESRLQHRRQIGGPALGFPQFEIVGIVGILNHTSSEVHAGKLLDDLSYARSRREAGQIQAACEHNDILAAGLARLLLWTVPRPMPLRPDVEGAWRYYLDAWRPGKPHPETWMELHAQAWEAVAPLDGGELTA